MLWFYILTDQLCTAGKSSPEIAFVALPLGAEPEAGSGLGSAVLGVAGTSTSLSTCTSAIVSSCAADLGTSTAWMPLQIPLE